MWIKWIIKHLRSHFIFLGRRGVYLALCKNEGQSSLLHLLWLLLNSHALKVLYPFSNGLKYSEFSFFTTIPQFQSTIDSHRPSLALSQVPPKLLLLAHQRLHALAPCRLLDLLKCQSSYGGLLSISVAALTLSTSLWTWSSGCGQVQFNSNLLVIIWLSDFFFCVNGLFIYNWIFTLQFYLKAIIN